MVFLCLLRGLIALPFVLWLVVVGRLLLVLRCWVLFCGFVTLFALLDIVCDCLCVCLC